MKTIATCCVLVALLCLCGESTAQKRTIRVLRDSTARPAGEPREHPGARAAWELERTRDPRTGRVPENIRARENAFASTLPVHRPSEGKGAALQSLQWSPMGPFNVGGRTRALAFDIANPQIMLAGAVSGGMWRTTDGGESWTKVTAPNDLHSATCVVQDTRPGKTQVWYYGTGELLSTTDRRVGTAKRTIAAGNGIYKSTDNGATWQVLASTDGGPAGVLASPFQGVWRLAIDPSNTAQDEVYAACYGAVMRSTDGGATWQVARGDVAQPSFSTEVAVTPTGVVYAALGSRRDTSRAPQQGVWRSVDGEQWADITPPGFPANIRRMVIAVAPSNENVLYLLTETQYVTGAMEYDFSASRHSLWKYTYHAGDGTGAGGTWENLSASLPGGPLSLDPAEGYNTLGAYCMALAVHPSDSRIVYLGGTDLFRTTDGFATTGGVQKIGGYPAVWEPDALHPDIHAVVFHPDDPSVMCVGNDGGLCWSFDALAPTVEWMVSNNGYISTQFYSVSLDHARADDGFIVGGLQDNGSFAVDGGDVETPWGLLLGGDGTGCAVADSGAVVYVSAQSGFVLGFVYDEQTEAYWFNGLQRPSQLDSDNFHFITTFVLEPTENNLMYLVARDRLWRHNGLRQITPMPFDPYWEELLSVQTDGASILSLAASVEPAHRLYLGTDNGRVLRIDGADGVQPVAVDITSGQFPGGAVVSSIAVDPADADRVLVSFSNYNVRSLFYTDDGGAHWTDVSGNLEEQPDGTGAGPSVRCVRIHRTGSGVTYFAGTSTGLFSTQTLAGVQTSWAQEAPTVIGSVIVEAIDSRAADGRVVIGTQGSGVFAARPSVVSVGGAGVVPPFLAEQSYPNPAATAAVVRLHLPAAERVSVEVYNTAGERVFSLPDATLSAGVHTVALPVEHLAPGAYFYRIRAGRAVQTRMMTVVR